MGAHKCASYLLLADSRKVISTTSQANSDYN